MEYTWSSSLIIASHDPLHASAFSCMASFYLVASPLVYFTLIRRMILSFVHLDRRPSDPSGPHPVSVPSSSGWWLPTPSDCQFPIAGSIRFSVFGFQFPTLLPVLSSFRFPALLSVLSSCRLHIVFDSRLCCRFYPIVGSIQSPFL